MKIEDYATFEPKFDLFAYFQGNTRGWGVFQDRSGALKRQFLVNIKGEVNKDGELVMTEDFVWNDGEISQRIWYIRKQDAHRYSGRAADVVGEAKGVAYGNALNWQYDLNLPVDGKVWQVHFDDWMYLQPDGVLLNRAKMSKFGFTLGEVTIVFQKR
ncbi:DUF3833 domain-containing protein [Thiothrix subterranea]|uniref:DUF3833 domain-containing protein n=1 Tax=Thiothrix subterranea TaxID=2735563 RepID=UPI00224BA93F|nr:DUF3833 domain-containing protein [Thiothrix subterranea]